MKIKVEKTLKLGLPNYSSVAFHAGVEKEVSEFELEKMQDKHQEMLIKNAFERAWELVEEEINKKAEPYQGHLAADKAADTDPKWIRDRDKENKGNTEPLPF